MRKLQYTQQQRLRTQAEAAKYYQPFYKERLQEEEKTYKEQQKKKKKGIGREHSYGKDTFPIPMPNTFQVCSKQFQALHFTLAQNNHS